MRIPVLFSSLLCLSSLAFASPELPLLPSAGTYSFSGDFSVALKLHYQIAHTITPSGREKLDRLLAEKYECRHKTRGTWLCKQFQAVDGAADIVRGRVERALAGKPFMIGERFGEPSLISEGTDVAEYKVIQNVSFEGKNWDYYRLVMTQGSWSIRMGEPTELQFSVENGSIKKWEQFPVTESNEAYSVYFVGAVFTRKAL
jgi:hypothetical protein